jgi:hypothetical protein
MKEGGQEMKNSDDKLIGCLGGIWLGAVFGYCFTIWLGMLIGFLGYILGIPIMYENINNIFGFLFPKLVMTCAVIGLIMGYNQS